MAPKLDFRLFLDRLSHISWDFTTIQKYAWILHLFIVFLVAKSASNIAVNFLDQKIQGPTKKEATHLIQPTPTAPKIVYPTKEQLNVITKRNIFNPKAPEEDVFTSERAKGAGLDEAGAIPTSLPLELVGTIILSDPRRSVAAIKDKGLNQTESYQIGDLIGKRAKVFKVESHKVYFQNVDSGIFEFVEIREESKSLSSAPSGPSADLGTGIRQAGEGRFVIDRGALESSLANPNEILTQARAVPNIVDGKIKGFRIFSIKPGSIYEKLGIHNGDVILRVNGIELDSPAKALEFYGAISSASDISLDVDRNGQLMSNNYTIK
ncbi:MAG: hypothetical protein HYW85_03060 [Deltaproteobacteria bacterium]|nr:hypothetical protein [Deltaproteobacteria bacterium]MBI3017950.1 hypothetical protein [Deltaproteobacteria bacterium]